MRMGLGLGLGSAPAGVAGFDLGLLDQARWDLSQLAGDTGDAQLSVVPSAVGAWGLTPVNFPTFDELAIGGRRALKTSNAGAAYLRVDALAAWIATRLAGGLPFNLTIRYRSTSIAIDQPLLAFGNSAGGGANYLQIYQTQLGKIKIISNTAGGGTITRLGTINTQLDEHVLTIVSSGSAFAAYLDGVTDTLDVSTVDSNAITLNRGAVGAVLTSAFTSALDGFVQYVGVGSVAINATQAAALNTYLLASDFTRALASREQVAWLGDSLVAGSAGTGDGGFRRRVVQWAVDQGLSLNFVGHRFQGLMPMRASFAQGGNQLLTIAGEFAANVSGKSPRLVFFMGGTNNQTLQTTAQALADYDAALATIEGAAVGANTLARIIVTPIPAFGAGATPAVTNEPNFNAALPGRWNSYDAAHPTRALIRADIKGYLGAYNASTYVDDTHYNDAGADQIASGFLAAVGAQFRAVSPTIAALNCKIKSHAAGATLNVGTQYTISGTVSRYPSSVQVELGSTVLGSATTNKRTWSFTWTPQAGDLGAQTLNAVATDTIDSSTASAPGVSITVAAAAYSPTDEGSEIGRWDVSDPACVVVDGSNNVLALKNLVTGVGASEATAPPSYVANGAPNGALPRVTYLAASSQKHQSVNDATFAAGLNGDDHPFTLVMAFRLTSTAFGTAGFFFSASGSIQQLGFGQASANYRVYKNPDSNTGAANQQSVALVGGWTILQVTFDGTTKQVTTRINNGTPVTSAFDTTTQALTRWAFGCLGGSSPSLFDGFDLLEARMFSDNKLGQNVVSGKDAVDRIFNYYNAKWGIGLAAR